MTENWARILTDYPIAHRGYFDNSGRHPENSSGAIVEAVQLGFGAELDVMLSSDGKVVVFHDDSLARMCGSDAKVSELTFEQLSACRLLESKEVIPAFSSVLAQVDGRRPLIVELKSFTSAGFEEDGALARAVVNALADYRGPVALKSFNPLTVLELLRLRGSSPLWPVGLISCDHSKDADFKFLTQEKMAELTDLNSSVARQCDFFSYNINDLSEDLAQQMRSRGPLLVWTVRTQEQFEKAKRLADNFVFEWRGVKASSFLAG